MLVAMEEPRPLEVDKGDLTQGRPIVSVATGYRLLQLNTNLTIMGIFGVGLGGGVACPKTSVDRIKNLTFPSGGCSIKRSSWLVWLLILATYFYTGANRPRQNFSTFIWFSPRHYKKSDYEITLQWNTQHVFTDKVRIPNLSNFLNFQTMTCHFSL